MNEIMKLKLGQAEDSLDEAQALLSENAEVAYVVNNLYYAFLYPVLGLLQSRNIQVPLQSTAISMFEREFISKGDFDVRFADGLRRAFDLKPKCSCEGPKKISREEVLPLLSLAREFLEKVRRSCS